jgi:hypothetical protein
MVDINILIARRDAIQKMLEDYIREREIKEEWYRRNSLVRDELDRRIKEIQNGAPPIEPISIEAVEAEIMEKKRKNAEFIYPTETTNYSFKEG